MAELNLAERAMRLKNDAEAILKSPLARLLPAPAVEILGRQAAITAELAISVRRIEDLLDMGVDGL